MPIRKSSISGGSSGIPSGATADRPESPAIGDQFYNGTLGILEIYSEAGWVPATGANDFNVSITATDCGVTFSRTFFAGSYTIESTLNDNVKDIHLFDSNNNLVGYSSTPSITASANFNRVVVYGGTTGDLLSFTFKNTFVAQQETNFFKVSPFILSNSSTALNEGDTSITLSGGNFSDTVVATFVGSSGSQTLAKSIVRNSETEIIVTRPDSLRESDSPYNLILTNPEATQDELATTRNVVQITVTDSSGGTISEFGGYRIHTFTSNDTLALYNINALSGLEYLVIGGGGAGGRGMGAGGGAGGLIHNLGTPDNSFVSGEYPIVVGAGAASNTTNGTVSGTPTTFATLTALGGGGGSSLNNARSNNAFNGAPGGSGGGAGAVDDGESGTGGAGQQPGSASGGYGNRGGNCSVGSGNFPSGGGGGAGTAGGDVTSNNQQSAGDGGAGLQVNIDGNNYYWAGGGGGGSYSGSGGAGNGGIGGGGGGSDEATGSPGVGGGSALNSGIDGQSGGNKPGGAGGQNTGSGGGGSSWSTPPGGAGGSGIVIVRYAI